VTGVAFVIQRELLEGLIAGVQRVEFEIEPPGSVTPRTGDRRCVVGWLLVSGWRVVRVGWRGRHGNSLRREPLVSIRRLLSVLW
jgi:hypothetical protein